MYFARQLAIKCVVCLHTLLCSPQCWVQKNKWDRAFAHSILFRKINPTICRNVSEPTKYSTLQGIVSLSINDWVMADIEHIFIHSQKSKQYETALFPCDACTLFTAKRTHLLLTAHENYVCVQSKATAPVTLMGHLLSENILSTDGIQWNRQNSRWKIALYRIRACFGIRKFLSEGRCQ